MTAATSAPTAATARRALFVVACLGMLTFGIVLTTLDEMNLGGPFEFSSQGGGGIQWFFNRQYALTLDARYRHISNAGIKDQNSGLNTLFIGISIGHFPDRQ